ncbi:SpaA isopeptide-forming pilin-related protein [Brevundimonas diminuta]|uniref:SdrD B-like domain-containing protein n=1 Tax=Brevundimonas diminuta TaxID=293 RepID=UPI0022AF0524|nr:SdrD B-like domain-containing protein [Brevundimonas diminuta]MCZ4109389.1 SpaA isopeptide-forming pilin-related protein [Brevundimonas diminuta]
MLQLLNSFKRVALRMARILAPLALTGAAGVAAAADLQVSDYTWSPDPVANGAQTSFTIRVTNNGPGSVADAVVTVAVPSHFAVRPGDLPSYCGLTGAVGSQTLTCALPPLAAGDFSFGFAADAVATGSRTSTATIASDTNVDSNPLNDTLVVSPAVQAGADLSVLKDDGEPDGSIPGGGILTYTLDVANSGPDATGAIRLIDNLPAASDFEFMSASGSLWNCGHSAGIVTCDYTGPATMGALPPVKVTGRVLASGGTITNNAFVELTSPTVLDPAPNNNTAPPVITTIEPGADLVAQKSMASTIIRGDSTTITLGVRNLGPLTVTGALIVDEIAPEFAIGSLPAGCSAVGQTVTCVAGGLSVGQGQNFQIPVTAIAATSGSVVNSVKVTPPAGVTDPVGGNDTASAGYRIAEPSSDLSIAKTKGPNPVAAGEIMTSAIRVRNNGPSVLNYSPANPLRITDTVTADETYVSADAPWVCSQTGLEIVCELGGPGSLAVGADAVLSLKTRAGSGIDLDLSNRACTGATGGSTATPSDPNVDNDCATAGSRSTPNAADLAIVKEVGLSPTGPWTQTPDLPVAVADNAFYIRFTVSNLGGDVARTVVVTDDLPNFINGGAFVTGFGVTSASQGAPAYTAANGRISWTVTDLAAGESESAVVRIGRPVESGRFDNVARVTSPDTTELNLANNQSTAAYDIAPITDITLNAKTIAPNPAQVGVTATYTISVRGLGPNPAASVVVKDVIDPARFELIGPPTTTKSGATCVKTDANGEITCDMGTINRGQTYQIRQQVRARFPFGGATSGFPISHVNTATVTTTTTESNTGNNSVELTHDVSAPIMDLAVTKQEPSAAFDPMPFGSELVYDLRASNFGPSRAGNIVITDIPAPPAGYTMSLSRFEVNPVGANSGLTLYTPPAPACVTVGANIECRLHGTDPALNYLDERRQVVFRLHMAVTGPAPTGPMTFSNSAEIVSLEQDNTTVSQADRELANNTAVQTTTVLPATDLEVVSKTRVTDSPIQINQPVEYRIVVRNNGVSPTTQVRVTDQLPSGWTRVGGETVMTSGSAAVSAMNCSGTSTVLCVLDGLFPGNGDVVTLTVFAKAAYPYAGVLDTDLTNTARIAPGRDGDGVEISRDTDPNNNSKTETTRVAQSSIAGVVYRDDNLNDVVDSGEGMGGVRLTLNGTDAFGNAVTARATDTNATGAFVFDRLPEGVYQIVETQPAGVFDRNETVGSAGGVVNNAAYGSTPATNVIADINLPAVTQATGYLFQEIGAARVSGYVYRDVNNNGLLDAGEAGFAPGDFASAPHIRLTGADYAGGAVNLTASVDADGHYVFNSVPPSGAAEYTITQLIQPNGASDGLDANGGNAVIPGSSGRPAPEGFDIGLVAPGSNLTGRNFGELPTSTLGGMVFLDPDADATRATTETTGLAGAIVRLSGTNDLGQAVDCSITTTATGLYRFPNAADASPICQVLRPGDYQLAITPAPGLTHTGAYVGALGGTSNGVAGPNAASPGLTAVGISDIVVFAGSTASNYDFGGTGQGLSGYVYIDRDASGVRDAGEAGIPGVTMTLSGTTANGQNVCDLADCTAVTDATGGFIFLGVPGSDATGYTLTEQAQNTPPLSNFFDGQEGVGSVGGEVGNDVIRGIVLPTGGLGANYAFGELPGSLAGGVFIDANDDGARQPGETAVSGVTVTLSGVTADGQDICAWRAALDPAQTCVVVTDAAGAYRFDDLPKGTYALTESQPTQFADGREGVGSVGGVAPNTVFDASAAANAITAITLEAGQKGVDYVFGERAVVITGTVYKDPQRDGVNGGGEPPIPGVTIELVKDGVVIATTTTGPDGTYSFVDLPGGDYTVREIQPDGYGSSTPNEVAVNLTPGAAQVVDFGETVSSIAGHVFVDANDDGVRQAGEASIAGVVVTLTGTDAAGESVTRTATTDAAGEWRIDDLLAGNYQLTEAQPEGFADGRDSAGSVGGLVEVDGDHIHGIVLPTGVDATDYAFGERGQGLNGTVYVDVNLDGSNGPGDRPLEGVVVELRKPSGELVATTTTGPDGSYSFGDIRGGDYVVVEIQPEGYGEGPENPSNRVPVTIRPDQTPPTVDFGERTGSLSGLTYNDANNNGVHDANEPVIGGVTLTLTGTDARGESVTRTVVSGPDGAYRFTDLPGGAYTVTETQPDGYDDGLDTPGTSGGLSDGGDVISGIVLAPAAEATGYLFGERGADAAISGSVWMDADHDRARGGGEAPQSDWTVELFLNDVLMDTVRTGADGGYAFTGVAPGSGYAVRFRHPQNNAAYGGARPNETGATFVDGVVSASNAGGATLKDRELTGVTLQPGATVPQQSLPLDPWGVVYDAVRRTPVQGAVVEINGPAGFDPAQHLLGGSGSARQTVDALGLYYFQLLNAAPAGVYTLSVTPPNGSYNPIQPSSILPPCVGPLTVHATPDPMLVSTSNGPPPVGTAETCATGTMTTGYVLSLNLTPGVSANVVNNNIPLDPILEGAIEVTKTTPMVNVVRGGLVPYVITARNTLAGTVPGVTLTDRTPAGFRYREGSARIDGAAVEPIQNGRLLTWNDLTFAAGETKRLELILVVGSGVVEGEHTNVAFAVNPIVDQVISNLAEATVRMIPDPDFDCTDILGKVFDDRNGNGVQDDGEPGLPGVRLATARGLLITTDAEGRYHITCPMIPNEDRGSNFIVKLDDRTLPTGYRVTSGNPETVRLTRGKFARLNFGAGLHRVVRLDLNGEAFDGEALRPEFEQQFESLIATLAERPSVLRLAYASRGEDADLIKDRVAQVRRRLQDRWNDERGRYRLVVEEETVVLSTPREGGVQ